MRTTPHTHLIQWLTDLHLDKADEASRDSLYQEIARSTADTILITGDTSSSRHLPLHLREVAAAASWRQVFFVLGNHDFYGSNFAQVDSCVAGICRSHANLRQLGHGEIIRLDSDTALVGHQGWGDGRMGFASKTLARNPDFQAISDFHGLDRNSLFALLKELGRKSATYMRDLLPYALSCYDHVLVATHVPPMSHAALFNGRACDWLRQPFYTNIAMGGLLLRMAQSFPKKKITVLAGHTHCAADFLAAPNLNVVVGGARPGYPRAQGLFEVSEVGLIAKE